MAIGIHAAGGKVAVFLYQESHHLEVIFGCFLAVLLTCA